MRQYLRNQILFKTNDLWDMHLDVNLTGTYNCIKALAPYMIKQNNGSIINITTVDAFQGCKGIHLIVRQKQVLLD